MKQFFVDHWQWMITTLGTVLGFLMGWFMKLWLSRDEREKLREENRLMKHLLNVESCAELIRIKAFVLKMNAGTHNILFSFDDIYGWGVDGGMETHVLSALQLLKEKGTIKESKLTPGQYYIDRPD